MGYSTTLYAISLDRLSTAVGCKDDKLIKEISQEATTTSQSKNHGKVVRLVIDNDGLILLNGGQAEIDEVVAAVRSLTGKGDNLRFNAGKSDRGREVMPRLYQAAKEAFESSGNYPNFFTCSVKSVWEDDEEFFGEGSEEHDNVALRAVVNSEHGNQEPADLAYAVEKLCNHLGEKLDTGDRLGDLEPLELDTPLLKWRMPVDLPTPADFPFVSYLTPEQVSSEVGRLESLDLSYPDDEDIEDARRALANCLKQAHASASAVVAFFY